MPWRFRRLAKLTRPRLARAVARPRLFDRLDDARASHPAVCVVGPPGAGKTTLVASWLDDRGIRGIWYQVDPEDADLAAFFFYLREAAGAYTPKGRRPLPALTPEYLSDIPRFTRRFFRDLGARLPVPGILVLDNCQEVAAEDGFHSVVADAIAELPEGITLVIISREQPPQAYARFAANDQMALLGWDELRLTLAEALAVANVKRPTGADLLRRVHESTGGWAAGLVMALQRIEDGHLPDEIEKVTHEAIFSYLADQVFDDLPLPTRRFLLETAYLPQIGPDVARMLTSNADAGKILEELFRRNFFTDRRLSDPPTYWYHALFRRFLQARATRELDPDALMALRRRAAHALYAAGDLDAAIPLLCDAQHWEEAERAILELAPALLASGRWKTFEERVGALPVEHRERSAWLSYWIGISSVSRDPRTARQRLERAYELFTLQGDFMGRLLSASAVSTAIYLEAAEFRTLTPWLKVLDELIACSPQFPSAAVELQVWSGLLIAITFGGPGHRAAGRCTERILELLAEPIDANQRITAAAATMLHALYTGGVHVGRRLEALVRRILDAPELTALNAAFWYCWLGYLSVVFHEPARGHKAFSKAEEIAQTEGFPYVLTSCYSGRSALLRVGPVDEWLARAERQMGSARPYDVAHYLGNCLYRAADRGDWAATVGYGVQTMTYLERMGTTYQQLMFEVPVAWALAELGRREEARHHLVVCKQLVEQTGAMCYTALVSLTDAHLARLEGNRERYVELLGDGFRNARQDLAMGRLVFWVPTAGAPRLCADALEQQIEPEFVRRYIQEYPLQPPADAPESWPWPIRIYTLGRFEILLGDKPIEFPHKSPRKPLALLKAIVAFGGSSVPAERLIDALWPDEEGDAALQAFEIALHRLRKLLAVQDAVTVVDRSVSLNQERVWTDVRALESTIAAIGRLAANIDDPSAEDQAERVLVLYRGHFLASDPQVAWAVSRRERVRSRFTQFVVALAMRYERGQDWDNAIRWYQTGIAADDLAESFYQGLMRCYLALGRRAEGLGVFRRMSLAFSTGLGVAPSAASEALRRGLLSS
jgi:ATP/maltotriose-dependent transcriptional regulator MalT/DNA-binding SARP family transcriptional activator